MVLVTGASGMVGRHLVSFLSAKDRQVRALYHSNAPNTELKQLKGVQWQRCDLLDIYDVEAAMEGIQEVYHCAGIVSFHPADREKLLHFNVESTANIVNEALERDIRKMIFVSSVSALGRSEDTQKNITEEEQWEESRYNSIYGLSKHLAEIEVWRGIGEGLNAAIINPATILGEGDWDKGSARLIKVVDKEFPFYTDGITAWVDVADVVKAAYTLMESDVAAERFIISNGNHSFREVFTLMAKALGKRPPHVRAGKILTGLVWRWNILQSALTGKPITVTKETAATALKKRYYDNSKFLTFFPGFRYTPLAQTISSMSDSYLKSKT